MAAILGVTVMFCHGKSHTLGIQSTTLLVLFLQIVTWTWTYSINEVCNFPSQNMTVTPKIAPAFALLYRSRFQRQTRGLNWQTRRFKRKREKMFAVSAWTQIAVFISFGSVLLTSELSLHTAKNHFLILRKKNLFQENFLEIRKKFLGRITSKFS